ncbi:MAG: hypothetical protein CMJ84_15975 [Planctomycetes bacterium]|nr:hypothetical protein [Planctomycetota bacterium]
MSTLLSVRAKGLLDRTLVVLGTKFGRTPRINDDRREQHDEAFACLPVGVGIEGGRQTGRWMGGVVRFDWASAGTADRRGHSERLRDARRQLRTGSREYR